MRSFSIIIFALGVFLLEYQKQFAPYQPYFGPRTALWIAPGVITAKKSLLATLRYEGVAQMAVFFLHTVTLITLQSWSRHCSQL